MNQQQTWNEDAERKQFEDACYAHYLAKRAARAAQGIVSAFDKSEDECWSREELFARESSGQYVAFAYRGAWFGWTMARKVD